MYPLAVLSHLWPRFAYILGNYGHVRSQGRHHSATANPPFYRYIVCLKSPRRRTGIPCALRASRPFYRHETYPFVEFFRDRARLPRPQPARACPVVCSRALAADVNAEVCMRNRLNVGTLMPASEYETIFRRRYRKLFDLVHTNR